MALDAVCLRAVIEELRPQLLDLRVDKVQQPSRDQVILLLRGSRRLLLNAGAGSPRIHFTELLRDNPAEPPMFCMLLRKYLVGGRVESLTQPGMERSAELTLRVTDEFGRESRRTLVLEAIGRRSNLILLDEERRIIDCLRRVDSEMSPERQVLPGLFYELPPTHEKRPFTEGDEADFRAALAAANPERPADAFLLDTYFGLSPLVARELVFQAAGDSGKRVYELTEAQETALWQAVLSLRQRVEDGDFQPICLYRDGKPAEFSYLPIRQYGDLMENREMESFSALMDVFYESREREERTRQRGQDLIRSVTSARDRCRRKLAQQRQEYAKCQDRDQLRISGELITANLYRMERGQTKLTAENYYDPDCREITIPLDPLLTPQQNAAKYYKRYTKARTAEKYLTEQMALAERDEAYLESVLEELRQAETEQDFLDIRAELRENGFLKRSGKEKKELKRATKPREFRTSGGWRVLVGRNNRQNDQLTTKTADYRDLWLHTQKIHGSHVILCCQGQAVPEEDLLQAARLAAYFSQAKDSANVPVDCAAVRYVKKPAGARPGMVTYTNARTLYVTPEEAEVKALSAERKGKNGGEVRQ
ncbi:MAG: NFACT RNA binding domain-containing protein [Dysosmobacter sp.]|nr:NFACT RNA binding domain-containing protein [Dysosmobacter sp.]